MLKVATVLPHEPYREYKDVERVYSGSTEIDKILDKDGNVLFAVNKEVEGTPALTYKGKEETNLKNYRIYGNTVGGESVGDLAESGEHAGEYKVPVTVEGKNLFDERNGDVTDTYINDDGIAIISPNGDKYICNRINVLPNNTYTFSWGKMVLGINGYPPYIRVAQCDNNNNFLSRMLIMCSNFPNKSYTVTTGNDVSLWDIRIDVASSRRGQHLEEVMLNSGSEPLSYEPYQLPVTTNIYLPEPLKMVGDEAEYIDFGEQKQHRVRKNLVQTIATSQTINDITFTVNANGSVTCNGTNHGNNPIIFELNNPDVVFPEGVYITSGCPAGGSITGGYKIQYFNGSSWNYELGSGSTFTISGNLKYRSRILISKDVTVTNLTFYPMLRLASIEDDTYEPYIESTDIDVTLPDLPTLSGTNTFTVGTEVQPSNVYLKGRIKEIT